MQGVPHSFWGKLEMDGDVVRTWHPLAHHCADVAACAEALLTRTLLGRRLARLAGRDALDEVTVARLCVLTALHDLGKFNQHFQNKGRPGVLPRAGHVREVLPLIDPCADREEATTLRAALERAGVSGWGSAVDALLAAAVAHHGRPLAWSSDATPFDPSQWAVAHGLDPLDGMSALAGAATQWFPRCLDDGDPLPETAVFQHGFAGLVMLADWIGSDRSHFPFSPSLDDRISFARCAALDALDAPRIATTDLRTVRDDAVSYAAFSDIETPHDVQRRMLSLPTPLDGSLVVLESETGSGKTEAALAHFFRLFQAGAVDGLYFALPTRTAATQIHQRVFDAVRRWFAGAENPPPVVLAVPGYLHVDDVDGVRGDRFEVLWKDDRETTRSFRDVRHRMWAAEHPKRYLAASVAVGTVDQCLLSTLMVDHAHLRSTALSRSLLVVDEVHASDTYMTHLLREVLAFHLRAGGHCMLMSATLGSEARDALLGRGARFHAAASTSLAIAEREPYPRITWRIEDGAVEHAGGFEVDRGKTVHTQLSTHLDDPAYLARRALDAARLGARVLVLRNTVRACIETQRALEAALRDSDEGLVLRVAGHPVPHHARYAKDDRVLLDKALEARLGKGSPPTGGCVVVTTQTVQQSLDLDADLLLTDLCPMDVLLQRIGRLHRHHRKDRARPEGFVDARCEVLVPDAPWTQFLKENGEPRGAHGIGTVYDDLRVLAATVAQLRETPVLEIPTMNRELVERTTHRDALARVVPPGDARWDAHVNRYLHGAYFAAVRGAKSVVISRAVEFGDATFAAVDDRRVSTRLGQGDRAATLPFPCQTALGSRVHRMNIPAFMAADLGDAELASDVAVDPAQIVFRLGAGRFAYDRLGLRREEAVPTDMEEGA